MSVKNKSAIRFRFNPHECIGEVVIGEKKAVLEVLGFVATGAIDMAAKLLEVDGTELYNAYCAARDSIIPKDHPVQTIKLGDISKPTVMKARNNTIAENFMKMQEYLEAKEPVEPVENVR